MTDRKKEKTLVLIKPDGVQRGLIGEIIKRYERTGLKLVALKMVVPTDEMVERHYLLILNGKLRLAKNLLSLTRKRAFSHQAIIQKK